MQNEVSHKCSSNISMTERSILSEILQNYDLDVFSIEKVRSVYKIYASKGVFCLKKIGNGYQRAQKSFYIMQYLKGKGFNNVASHYFTTDNKAFIKYKNSAFYLTNWIEGREANFRLLEDILKCTELLARFHSYVKGFEVSNNIKIKSKYGKWNKEFNKYLGDMEYFKKHIDSLKHKKEFDFIYRQNIDYFCYEAKLALKILKHTKYKNICDNIKNERYICHDSFYYQNILIDNYNQFYIIDLESCIYDIPIGDLGKFIRRIMTKKKFMWDFDLCRRIIDNYCKIREISKEEYSILLAMLIFPHKFWKLGKKRYIKNKAWGEEKYKKKIRKLILQKQYKNEFIRCFIAIYNLDVDYI